MAEAQIIVSTKARKMPIFIFWLGFVVLNLPVKWFFKIEVKKHD